MFDALNWAMNDAPVRDPLERLVLESYAMKADGDGCNAFPAMSWLAERTMIDERTIKERRAELIKRGLLKLADDQSPANYIPKNRRPKVYEVMVPCSWWDKDELERINRFRATRGRAPITPESRPDLAPVERRRRSDAGKKRPQRNSGDTPVDSGGTYMPPQDSESGGTYMPPPGGTYMPPPGGTYMPPNLSLDLPQYLSLPGAAVEQSGAAGRGLDQAGRQGETGDQDQQAVLPDETAAAGQDQAVQIIQSIRWTGRRADRGTQRRLTTLAGQCLAAGHSVGAVQAAVTEGLPAVWGAGLLVRRLEELAATTPDPAVAAAAEREAAAADKARMATTSHAYQQGRSVGWCVRCGQHEGNRVHRKHQERVDQDQEPGHHQEPAPGRDAAPDTGQASPTGRCQHGRRVCVTCHGGRPDDTTGSGDRQRPAPRQRPAADPDPAPVSGPTPAGQEFHRALAAMAGRMVAA